MDLVVMYDLPIVEDTRLRRLCALLVMMLLCSPVSGQPPSAKVRIGVRADLDKLEAAQDIVHTHIANPQGRDYPLSPGESNYAPFFENLCRIGYSGRLSIEASTSDFAVQAPRAIAMLRKGLACPGR